MNIISSYGQFGINYYVTKKGEFFIEQQGDTVALYNPNGKCIATEKIDFSLNGDINSAWDELVSLIGL